MRECGKDAKYRTCMYNLQKDSYSSCQEQAFLELDRVRKIVGSILGGITPKTLKFEVTAQNNVSDFLIHTAVAFVSSSPTCRNGTK